MLFSNHQMPNLAVSSINWLSSYACEQLYENDNWLTSKQNLDIEKRFRKKTGHKYLNIIGRRKEKVIT